MNRNRVMRGLGLIALVMLAFGLAGCGSEPAPVARPPAPPPAPPPFQPQAVEVALGESGETVTLMTAEGGGFTLNGEAFAGGVVPAENGNKYLLALADGTWTAAFQEPAGIEVMLGDHGGTVIITMTEDGKYFIGEMEITADTMVKGDNGQYYTPGLDEEGMWMAIHVVPDPVSVMLGDHGGSRMLQLAEDNTWWYDGMLFEEDGMLKGDNGQYYTLSTDEEGMWMAMHVVPDPVSVMLGDHGGSRMLQLAEDNTWWYDGMLFADGEMLKGDNGQYYTLSMDDEGMWMAMHVMPDPVMVALGTSGSVELQQAEDLSWWIGTMAFASGDSYDAANGNEYMLTYDMETGAWSSSFVPMEMEIMGTGLVAMSREGDDMYDVAGSEDTIPASGMGDVTIDGAMYHVWMDEDDMLMGARFAMAIVDSTAIGPEEADGDILNPLGLALSADDEDTAANEAMTHLVLDELHFSIGDLLESGSLSKTGKTFVEEAREEVAKLLDQVEKLVAINAALDRDDRTDFTTTYDRLWHTNAQKAIAELFGKGVITLDPLQKRAGKAVEDNVVEDFTALLDALLTASAFEDALDDDGIFEDAQEDLDREGKDAMEVFEAATSESTVILGYTETTRYGVFAKQSRETAVDDLEYVHAEEQGAIGAFAYGTVADTARTSHLPDSGTASFTGGTTAVTGHKEPRLYEGRFDMEVSFPTSRVTAQVSELEDAEGEPWQHQLRDVATIYLPNASLDRNAHFETDNAASVVYTGFAAQPVPVRAASFEGWLLGAGRDEATATGAFGTWSLGDPENARGTYLAGAFGVDRTDIRESDAPDVEGEGVETLLTDKEDAIKKGRTVFRPLGTAKDPDDPDGKGYIEISLSTLEEDEDGSYTRNGDRTVDGLKADLQGLLNKLEGVILTDEADGEIGDEPDLKADRAVIWDDIRAKIRSVIFGLGLKTYRRADDGTLQNPDGSDPGGANSPAPEMIDVLVEEGGRGRPAYDYELGMRPAGSDAGTDAEPYTVDMDGDGTAETVRLEERALLYVLSGVNYPTSGSKPNDSQATSEIRDVLDALDSAGELEDALDDGIFEGLRAETGRTTYEDDNYDSYADVDANEDKEDRERDVDSRKTGGDIYDARTNKVIVRFGSTDFTRFGVSWGAGATDGKTANHFAYSPLPQTRYLDEGSPGYPAVGGEEARATYTGRTIFKNGTVSYHGDVEIDVTWDPGSIGDSKVTTSLSALETIADGDPFTIAYILVNETGTRFLKNGTTAFVDYSDGTANPPGYDPRPLEVSGGPGDAATNNETLEGYDIRKDPRNTFAAGVEFDVAEIIIHRNISVTTTGDDDDLVGFSGMNSNVDIVWEDKAFGRTELHHSAASIDAQFLGQGLDGPLAVMGLWSFIAPTGVLRAQAVVGIGSEAAPEGGDRGKAAFEPLEVLELGQVVSLDHFSPNERWKDTSARDLTALIQLDNNGNPQIVPSTTVNTEGVFEDAAGVMRIRGTTTVTAKQVSEEGYVVTNITKTFNPAKVPAADPILPDYGPRIFGAFGTGP